LRDAGKMKLKTGFPKSLIVSLLCGLLFVAAPRIAISQAEQPQRPTSTPYTGDLSIFEKPGRDERLQIQRVMDLLGIRAGSSVADIGLVGGGLRCRARHRGCVVPSPSESDSPVHRSSVRARCFLSLYWTTSEEASLVQRCLEENSPFQQFASPLTMLPSQRDDWAVGSLPHS